MNNIINWDEAPEWATHCAQDANGLWAWFPQKPEVHPTESTWYHNYALVGICTRNYKTTTVIGDWKDNLIERPKQEIKMTKKFIAVDTRTRTVEGFGSTLEKVIEQLTEHYSLKQIKEGVDIFEISSTFEVTGLSIKASEPKLTEGDF